MSNILVISGHPNLEQSHTNTVILEQLHSELDNVEIRRLDSLYPNYQIVAWIACTRIIRLMLQQSSKR